MNSIVRDFDNEGIYWFFDFSDFYNSRSKFLLLKSNINVRVNTNKKPNYNYTPMLNRLKFK